MELRRGRDKKGTATAAAHRRWPKALAEEINRDIQAARKIRLPWWALIYIGIGSFFASWLFDVLGRFELVVPALGTAGVLAFAAYVKRNLIHQAWFWGTMAIIAAFHVAVILLIPWTTHWVPAVTISAIGSVDLSVILATVSVVGRFMEARHSGTANKSHALSP